MKMNSCEKKSEMNLKSTKILTNKSNALLEIIIKIQFKDNTIRHCTAINK